MKGPQLLSTALRQVLYFPDAQSLEVEFSSGDIYTYCDVPEDLYRQLLSAESKGRFFNRMIRPRFGYQQRSTVQN